MNRVFAGLFVVFTITFSGGCVTVSPDAISSDIARVSLNAARDNPELYAGKQVRLGGDIASVKSFRELTVIEVVSRDLGRNNRPKQSDKTEGRFLANIKGFVDPAIYTEGRYITVTGILAGNKEQVIGEYPYQYPVVNVDSHHLWPKLPESSLYDTRDRWFYRPWYPGYNIWHDRYPPYWWDHPFYW